MDNMDWIKQEFERNHKSHEYLREEIRSFRNDIIQLRDTIIENKTDISWLKTKMVGSGILGAGMFQLIEYISKMIKG